MHYDADDRVTETWTVRKPVVESCAGGLVASQHHLASDAGARVLAAGGNAVDAAVTAGLAIGAVEPWMSGLGGGGYMLVRRAGEDRVHAVEFPMRAPRKLDPQDYPLSGGTDRDLFGWPAVLDARNVHGPYAFAVPGHVAGMALALERFGTLPWREAMAPAVALARSGLLVDWFAVLKIAAAAATLARYPESARVYLPGGFPPAGEWGGPSPRIALGALPDTLARLAEAGPEDFYRGELAAALVADAAAAGSSLSREDLAGYRAEVTAAPALAYRGGRVFAAPGLTAGKTLHQALAHVARTVEQPGAAPDAAAYLAYAQGMLGAYEERLRTMGEAATGDEGCTTHLSVVDRDGNLVALTQTLLSVFGSKVVLPGTGILMNNGIMWFDPRPGGPNSVGPGRVPLSNMCPAMVLRADGTWLAVGASGGRRIMSAVMQLASFFADYSLPLEDLVHRPRIDVSGTDTVTLDPRLDADVQAAIAARHRTEVHESTVYPVRYASPNLVVHDGAGGGNAGGAFVMSPWSKVSVG